MRSVRTGRAEAEHEWCGVLFTFRHNRYQKFNNQKRTTKQVYYMINHIEKQREVRGLNVYDKK
nr:hypothetical protein [uncultured Prevotella sp.]